MNGEKRDFDPMAATWDENPVRVKMAQDVARAIRETVKLRPDMDVLDFGCGTGLLTLNLQPLVGTITGVDSSRGMLDILERKIRAQGYRNVRTRLVDLDKGDTLEGSYDLVVCGMTLHHIPEIQQLIDRFVAVLKPHGILAIADLDCDEGKFHESNEGVFHAGFDRCAMQKYFRNAGLRDIRNRTAAIVRKPGPAGEMRTFTVFVMSGRKG
jgi:ubiquinone/menaquinone biosynthesis C-methylase UbiE